ncbi:hypothetical protein LX64_00700 [Chitinophaga skermanii]|uniref:Uncharacterized protein n=1 Tax=Chitinophaga skermanii TaxID=331697 RepID=A0A327R557_9BACT|nr:hypothetical protein [Chitinophaga skermanii]RAJ11092.1 hypothetical protein LX64_00700 [Chitinophaga skermanii]
METTSPMSLLVDFEQENLSNSRKQEYFDIEPVNKIHRSITIKLNDEELKICRDFNSDALVILFIGTVLVFLQVMIAGGNGKANILASLVGIAFTIIATAFGMYLSFRKKPRVVYTVNKNGIVFGNKLYGWEGIGEVFFVTRFFPYYDEGRKVYDTKEYFVLYFNEDFQYFPMPPDKEHLATAINHLRP